jgi:hypothetical protein
MLSVTGVIIWAEEVVGAKENADEGSGERIAVFP